MIDKFGRNIDYMRVSVTDRCNLRCKYCMPNGIELTTHESVLSYEEFLRVCRAAVAVGITKFKVTGGEPLARLGCAGFVRELKAEAGVEQVTLTTNGVLLEPVLTELAAAGIDGINISLDTLNKQRFAALTGGAEGGVDKILSALERCPALGIKTKINTVLLQSNQDELVNIARLAEKGVDVRFIELMPIGIGASLSGADPAAALETLKKEWGDLHPVSERRGNGPAHYYASAALKGRIGMIDAVSHKFCAECNRVRLTSTGYLKPCLCYDEGADLRALLRGGASDEQLKAELERAVYEKPRAHCFDEKQSITEKRIMSQIGG